MDLDGSLSSCIRRKLVSQCQQPRSKMPWTTLKKHKALVGSSVSIAHSSICRMSTRVNSRAASSTALVVSLMHKVDVMLASGRLAPKTSRIRRQSTCSKSPDHMVSGAPTERMESHWILRDCTRLMRWPTTIDYVNSRRSKISRRIQNPDWASVKESKICSEAAACANHLACNMRTLCTSFRLEQPKPTSAPTRKKT